MRRAIIWFIILAILAVALIEIRAWFDRRPQDLPWTKLDLDDPVGRFTAAKLAALGDNPAQCRAMLAAAGALDRPAPNRILSEDCAYRDGMLLRGGEARRANFAPPALVTSCPGAAALLLWDERVLQPAARRHFGEAVTRLIHAGSFSCRRIYNRSQGAWSEHATADAVDITGFQLADGRIISVLRDWEPERPAGAFLREVRDGACGMFATVLSPDYNLAHRDHLHLDQAKRGEMGFRVCR